jgi:hypothetical protein
MAGATLQPTRHSSVWHVPAGTHHAHTVPGHQRLSNAQPKTVPERRSDPAVGDARGSRKAASFWDTSRGADSCVEREVLVVPLPVQIAESVVVTGQSELVATARGGADRRRSRPPRGRHAA